MIGIAIVLLIVIAGLFLYIKMQINSVGMSTKNFYEFVKANVKIQKVARFAKMYDGLTSKEQLAFIEEAKEIFDAFDNVPTMLWEEDHANYMDILEKYQQIKNRNWKHGVTEDRFIEILEDLAKEEDKEAWMRKHGKLPEKKVINLNLNHARKKLLQKAKDEHGHINVSFANIVFISIYAIIMIRAITQVT